MKASLKDAVIICSSLSYLVLLVPILSSSLSSRILEQRCDCIMTDYYNLPASMPVKDSHRVASDVDELPGRTAVLTGFVGDFHIDKHSVLDDICFLGVPEQAVGDFLMECEKKGVGEERQ